MAWTTPTTRTTGELVTASIWNVDLVDDLIALRAGALAIASQGANEIPYASSATQLARSALFTFNGTVFTVGGFGTHAFSASGTGANNIRVRNTSAGAGNWAYFAAGNDNTATALTVASFASNWAPSTALEPANGASINSTLNGGLTLAASEATGIIRFITGGSTQRGQITAAGLFSWETFGTHKFAAGGTGANTLWVENQNSGAANYARVIAVENNDRSTQLIQYSSSFTTSGASVQAGGHLVADGSGGLSIQTSHASGAIRFYPGGSTERGRIHSSGGFSWGDTTDPGATNFRVAGSSALVGLATLSAGLVVNGANAYINDTSNAQMTLGLTINQGANDDEILAFKSSDVAHGVTDVTETDTYALAKKIYAATSPGGLELYGLTQSGGSAGIIGIRLLGVAADSNVSHSTGGQGQIMLSAYSYSGTALANPAAGKNICVIQSGSNTRFIFDSDGSSYEDVGTAWTNFDEHDDVAVIEALEYELSKDGPNPIDLQFATWLRGRRKYLERLQLVTFNDFDGHHFINRSRMQNLLCGAVRQLAAQNRGLQSQLTELQRRLS